MTAFGMSVSDITVAALTTTPGIGYIGLTWTYADPRSGALSNLALDMVEVWASTTNDRSTAAKVAEGITSARHSGVANGVTWYYWIKARDNIGGYGSFIQRRLRPACRERKQPRRRLRFLL
jgi:predicted phage tail protein